MQTFVAMIVCRHLVSAMDHTQLNRDSFLQPLKVLVDLLLEYYQAKVVIGGKWKLGILSKCLSRNNKHSLLVGIVKEAASMMDLDHQLEIIHLALGMEEEEIIKPALEDL